MEKLQVKFRLFNTLLWSMQTLLAVTFLWAGYVKFFTPAEQLAFMWPWTTGKPVLVIVAAIADMLAGIGILAPRLLGLWPVLTLYACYGIMLLMFAAIVFHVSRGEVSNLWINFAIILMAVLIIFILANPINRK